MSCCVKDKKSNLSEVVSEREKWGRIDQPIIFKSEARAFIEEVMFTKGEAEMLKMVIETT